MKKIFWLKANTDLEMLILSHASQPPSSCSNSIKKTLEKCVRSAQSLIIKTPDVVLASL